MVMFAAVVSIVLMMIHHADALQFERDQNGVPFINNQARGPNGWDSLLGTVGDQSALHHSTAGARDYAKPQWGDTIYNGPNSYTKVAFDGSFKHCTCPSPGTPGSCSCG